MQNDSGKSESRKPGRPKSDQVKIRQYFYITESELNSLRAVSESRQLSVSAIVREVLVLQVLQPSTEQVFIFPRD